MSAADIQGNKINHARVSQGTRRDAQPVAFTSKWETFTEEYDDLKRRLIDCQVRLQAYSRVEFSSEQMRIRRQYPATSLERWLSRRAEMETERKVITAEVHTITQRIMELKPKVLLERQVQEDAQKQRYLASTESVSRYKVHALQLEELRKITSLLTAIAEKIGAKVQP